MDLVGKIIGNRYEILEKIGVGGMATVYRAKCHVLNRYVAIKVLKDEFTTDEEFIRRFNIEAQAAASLSHPNIVSIYDVANEGNLYYIVMELVKGKTLKQIINEDGALPWKWSVNIAIQIASALETAHKNNIVHRDVKPHNIIITEEGVAKVTDFGIAKAVSNSTITAFGTTIGSVHYFSPEHARGGYTDAKSDIYSLGIVMYEMLTGRVPFDADTAVSVALKHMQEKPTEPMKLNPSIPFAVNKIIMKAIQKEVSSRYQSATEMIRDLTMALKNPEGDFVNEEVLEEDATQILSTLHLEEEQGKEDEKGKKKKKGKMAQFFEKHPRLKIPAIFLTFLLIFVLTLIITYNVVSIISNANKVNDVYIPNLVGMTSDEAKQTVEDLKVVYEVIGEEYNTEYEAGQVISQDPRYIENYRIKENSTIKVIISKGTEKATVPTALEGKTYEEVEAKLKEANLVAEKVEEKSTKVEEGMTIRVEPDEGTEINAGDKVQVFVSIGTGIPKVTVDNVVGKTEEEAKKILTDKKLEVNVEYGEDNTKENGIVLKQSVESGTEVEENSKITLTVNKIATLTDGTVNINLKTLTGYTAPTQSTTNTVNGTNTTSSSVREEKVTLRVVVKSGDGSEDTIENKEYLPSTEKISISFKAVGNTQVSVYVDGTLKDRKQQNMEREPIFNFN